MAVALGLAGKARAQELRSQAVALFGGGIGLVVLLLALVRPVLLGPVWNSSRRTVQADAGTQILVPLRGADKSMVLPANGWADADQFGLRQGSIVVQVTKVVLAPSVCKPSKGACIKVLHVCLRVRNVGPDIVTYESWAANGSIVSLKDTMGKVYSLAELPRGMQTPGRIERALIDSGNFVDDTLLCAPPAVGSAGLYLELDGAAFGCKGRFKFRIPGSTITEGPVQEPNSAPIIQPGVFRSYSRITR